MSTQRENKASRRKSICDEQKTRDWKWGRKWRLMPLICHHSLAMYRFGLDCSCPFNDTSGVLEQHKLNLQHPQSTRAYARAHAHTHAQTLDREKRSFLWAVQEIQATCWSPTSRGSQSRWTLSMQSGLQTEGDVTRTDFTSWFKTVGMSIQQVHQSQLIPSLSWWRSW